LLNALNEDDCSMRLPAGRRRCASAWSLSYKVAFYRGVTRTGNFDLRLQ